MLTEEEKQRLSELKKLSKELTKRFNNARGEGDSRNTHLAQREVYGQIRDLEAKAGKRISEANQLNNHMAKAVINEAKKHPANCKCKECMKAKKADKKDTMKESTDVSSFVKAITEKNYAVANKYLQSVVNVKIKGRIAQVANEKPF